MHWVLQVIGFCSECTKGISEWISGIGTRLPIDVATRRLPVGSTLGGPHSGGWSKIFVDSREQVRLHFARSGLQGGRQMKHLYPSALAHVSLEYGPERRLRLVCFECCNLGFESGAYINHGGRRRESNGLPVGQCEIRS